MINALPRSAYSLQVNLLRPTLLSFFVRSQPVSANNFWISGFFFCFLPNSPQWARASSLMRFLDHTQRRTTAGRTPLDEWSARRRDLYPTTHNTHNIQISMPPVGFEPTIPANERPQTIALDGAATGTGKLKIWNDQYTNKCLFIFILILQAYVMRYVYHQ